MLLYMEIDEDNIISKSNPLQEWKKNNKLERYHFMSVDQLRSDQTLVFLYVSRLGWVGQTKEEWEEPYLDKCKMNEHDSKKIDSIIQKSYEMESKLIAKQKEQGFNDKDFRDRLERNVKNIMKKYEANNTIYKKKPPPFPGEPNEAKTLNPEEYLNEYYTTTPYPTSEQYDEIAKETKMNRKQIPKWFQKKRKNPSAKSTPVRRPKKQAVPVPTLVYLLDSYQAVDNNNHLRIRNYNNMRDINGNTALHYAAAYNVDMKAVKLLLRRLSPEERDYTNRFGYTALDAAYARLNIGNDIGGEEIRRLLESNGLHRGEENFIHRKTRARSNSFELLKFRF